jgi:hypothetical protein
MQKTDLFADLAELLSFRDENDALEDKLKKWAEPPSTTEQEKSDHAVSMVKKAIEADSTLAAKDVTPFPKGSFHNRTNIRSESDVDVGVRLNTLFYNVYPAGTTCYDFGFSPATYGLDDFKKDVAKAIVSYFGEKETTVDDKAIQVHSNTVRVDADVVPHAIHRIYNTDKTYIEGVALKTSDGKIIYNYPDQDYDNGVQKNSETGRRYKALVRILKNLKCEMIEKGYESPSKAKSFLLASLAYNIPNYYFEEESYVKMTEDGLEFLKERTSDINNVKSWKEVNGIKELFGSHQGWKFDETHTFICDMLSYLQDLKNEK